MSTIVEITNLSVWFGKLQAIKDVSMEIKSGEFVAIVGPSGCGKSTLLRVIAGTIPSLFHATLKGKVSVLGTLPSKVPGGQIDMIFQEGNLLPWRTAISNAKLGIEILRKNNSHHSANELLHAVGLEGFEKSHPRELSGGMKQRVALISSLLTEPKLLLMDEPFGALDSFTRTDMWNVITELRKKGSVKTAALITHDPIESAVLANRIIVISKRPGTIVGNIPNDIPWPRVQIDGSIRQECSDLANEIRRRIKEVNGE